jgi:myo-inositol-1(or 4)-monophosphatase
MHPYVNTAVKAARKAGEFIARSLDKVNDLTVETKGSEDFVSEVDRKAEKIIVDTILSAYPTHGILGEEFGEKPGEEDLVWIIDPLDGTANFLHGLPHFAISIALQRQGKIEHGIIYDPMLQEMFTATRGKGAQLNNYRIRTTQKKSLAGCLIGTGFPYRQKSAFPSYQETFQRIFEQASDIRRAGSAALDLAYVAAGRLDGYWEMGLKPWDIAAGALLVKEAGGIVSDFQGGEDFLTSGNIVAASSRLFKPFLQQVHMGLGDQRNQAT